MRKRLLSLVLTFMMIFSFAVTCFAASSPSATAIPTADKETTGDGSGKGNTDQDGKQNTSDVSPKTGYATEAAFFAMITAFGAVVVSTKKCSE